MLKLRDIDDPIELVIVVVTVIVALGLSYFGVTVGARLWAGDPSMARFGQWWDIATMSGVFAVGSMVVVLMFTAYLHEVTNPNCEYANWKYLRDFAIVFLCALGAYVSIRLSLKHMFQIKWLPAQGYVAFAGAVIWVSVFRLVRARKQYRRMGPPPAEWNNDHPGISTA